MRYFNNTLNMKVIEDWQDKLKEIAGSWNGDEPTFNFEGDVYGEYVAQDAHEADELLQKVKEIFERMNY